MARALTGIFCLAQSRHRGPAGPSTTQRWQMGRSQRPQRKFVACFLCLKQKSCSPASAGTEVSTFANSKPHLPQNRFVSGFSLPQRGQFTGEIIRGRNNG
jgi:hypothetical protein